MTNCSIEQCKRNTKSKTTDVCAYHYKKLRRTPTYNAFFQSKNRCTNPNNPRYKDYGGRGIKMCDRWSGTGGYKNFIEDMGARPDGMTLDRIDNEKGYSKENCRWTTVEQQNLNKRPYSTNKSGFRGVSKYTYTDQWIVYIRRNGKATHIGMFDKLEDAIKARLEAELDREALLKIKSA